MSEVLRRVVESVFKEGVVEVDVQELDHGEDGVMDCSQQAPARSPYLLLPHMERPPRLTFLQAFHLS